MSTESVFTVRGATATIAEPISLADAGLRERTHLQEWVLAHPQVLGPDVKIVTFEFGRWTGNSGPLERDRLDVLGLDREGRLVVVELKRDRAPDAAEMQALKYAALVSRFTRDDLAKVHAQYLTRRQGEPVDADTALAELEEWATLDEQTLRLPRVVLMASGFPPTVTATVVFLHQQLDLDVRLLAFQAYRTANDVIITVSQHYPPPDVEEFVLSPEVSEARKARSDRQIRQSDVSTVARLLEDGALEPGQRLHFKAPTARLQEQIEPWLAERDSRRWAQWQDDAARPLIWEADGQPYSPTGLARHILGEAADRTSQVQGPLYWVTDEDQNLVELARDLPAADVPIETHLDQLPEALKPVYGALDAAICELGPDVTRRSRVRGIKYYGQRKLCDLLIHADHLSVYIRGLDVNAHQGGVVVGGAKKYLHAQVRTAADVEPTVALLKQAYVTQAR